MKEGGGGEREEAYIVSFYHVDLLSEASDLTP